MQRRLQVMTGSQEIGISRKRTHACVLFVPVRKTILTIHV